MNGENFMSMVRSTMAAGLLLGIPRLLMGQQPTTGAAGDALLPPPPIDQPITGRAIPCEQGQIKIFACRNVELLSYLPPSAIGGAGTYDIWGWTDSTTGREFVLIGGTVGTAFVEVTDPVNPKYLGVLPLHGREDLEVPGWPGVKVTRKIPGIKVYQHYAFIVAEGAADQGMQIFDLAQLRDVRNAPVTFTETAHYGNLGNAHTLAIDAATGFAYANGSVVPKGEFYCRGGLHMIDVRTPTQPTFVYCYPETLGGSRQTESGYVHDTQCVVYHGPDRRYQGREICVNSAEEALGIVDVTDKRHPKVLGIGRYPDVGYTHQGWLTDDQRYLFLDDEGTPDDKTRTIIFDVSDLGDPVVSTIFYGTTTARAHNLYIRGRYMYQSNYAAGLRILDIADPTHPNEVGYLDTYPASDTPDEVLGSWGNYPFLKHNVVAVAGNGLFLLRLLRSR